MLIYKTYFSLLTLFSLLIYIYLWAWPKGACRMQTDRSTDKQTNRRSLEATPKNWRTDEVSDLNQELAKTNKQTNRHTISRGYAKELANKQTDIRSMSPTPKNWRIGEQECG